MSSELSVLFLNKNEKLEFGNIISRNGKRILARDAIEVIDYPSTSCNEYNLGVSSRIVKINGIFN